MAYRRGSERGANEAVGRIGDPSECTRGTPIAFGPTLPTGGDMNWQSIKADWKDLRGRARVQWGKLTDDELAQIRGNREQLEAAIIKRYGVAKEEAARQVDAWAQKLKRKIEPR
jgi:uncharacterized protein YjbJ (UPF0337 family)